MSKVDSNMKAWIEAWKRASRTLEDLRKKELPNVNTAEAIGTLAGSFSWALRTCPPRRSSGLIEMQRHFRKLRPR